MKPSISIHEPRWLGESRRQPQGFSLVEILVAVSLLSLIVLALMAVFNSTQRAFRASVTQTDVLEGGRAAVELLASDLRQISPSGGYSNMNFGAVNFYTSSNNYSYAPLVQTLPGTSTVSRTNLLSSFFLLSRQNTKWVGIGYVVDTASSSNLYPLYRFYAEQSIHADPLLLFSNFNQQVYYAQWTNLSHIVDGVVHLNVRAYDISGNWMTRQTNANSGSGLITTNKNVWFSTPFGGEVGFYFFSNTVPASVELQIGLLEDRPLQRAGSLPFQSPAQLNYLKQQSGKVHIFRQQVTIPNVDPTAYQ